MLKNQLLWKQWNKQKLPLEALQQQAERSIRGMHRTNGELIRGWLQPAKKMDWLGICTSSSRTSVIQVTKRVIFLSYIYFVKVSANQAKFADLSQVSLHYNSSAEEPLDINSFWKMWYHFWCTALTRTIVSTSFDFVSHCAYSHSTTLLFPTRQQWQNSF